MSLGNVTVLWAENETSTFTMSTWGHTMRIQWGYHAVGGDRKESVGRQQKWDCYRTSLLQSKKRSGSQTSEDPMPMLPAPEGLV